MVDLGEPKGTCTYCGNIIRYVHIIEKKEWGRMGVGCCCACRLTQSTEPEKKEKALKMYQEKLEQYLNSKRWKHYKNGSFYTLEGYKIKTWDHQSYANLQIDYLVHTTLFVNPRAATIAMARSIDMIRYFFIQRKFMGCR